LGQPLLPLGNGRYELREVLGAGGMATVYRAYDQRLQCERAIKVLAPALSERTSIRNRFIAEARTMARLQHPNIVHVDEVVYDEGPVYMVMEMVRRGSLMDILKHHGPMPPKLASAVLQPVLAALAVAHQAGIIHRDIKPHNILMTETGIPKLTDFGIAQIRGTSSTASTRTNTMMGTLAYMAPEQRSSARRVDARSDVYSVGATVYTLVTLGEPHDIFAAEIHAELLANVHPELATLIRGATRYKPEERYQSAREMLGALKALHPRLPEQTEAWAGLDEATVGGATGVSESSLPPTHHSLYPINSPSGSAAPTIDAGLTMNVTGLGGLTIPSSTATKYVVGEGMPSILGLGSAASHTAFDRPDDQRTPFTIMPRDPPPDEARIDPTLPPPSVPSASAEPVNTRTAVVSSLVSAVIATIVVAIGLQLRADPPEPATGPAPAPIALPAAATPVVSPPVVSPPVETEPVETEPVETEPVEPAVEAEPMLPPRETPRPVSEVAPQTEQAPLLASTLGINSIPWSRVAIDGTDRGTSGKRFAVEEGLHDVVLTTETGAETRVTLDVAAGGTRIYCWDFEKGTECLR
jgi:eukaryotic-like serine/threonine-protein kinase